MTGSATLVGLGRRATRQKLLIGHIFTVLAIQMRLELEFVKNWPAMLADNTFRCSMAPPL